MNIAILFSGHLRNIHQHIDNLKENLIDVLTENGYNCSIYIHTWDNNLIERTIHTRMEDFNKWYNKENCDIKSLLKQNNINLEGLLIENQQEVYDNLNLDDYTNNIIKNGKGVNKGTNIVTYNPDFIKQSIKQTFFQFYGYKKSFELVKNKGKFSYIIKTRPDAYYNDKFDINLLNYDVFFPNSHLYNGTSINPMFFGGKSEFVTKILNYYDFIVYNKGELNYNPVIKYSKNKNCVGLVILLRYFVLNYLNLNVHFCKFNPYIYRTKGIIHRVI